MSSPWRIRIGRLAIARQFYGAIGGWRRLFWLVWWREPEHRLLKHAAPRWDVYAHGEDLLEQARAKGPMHWSRDGRGVPYCGEDRRGARWTVELAFSTCDACRKDGWKIDLAHKIGNR